MKTLFLAILLATSSTILTFPSEASLYPQTFKELREQFEPSFVKYSCDPKSILRLCYSVEDAACETLAHEAAQECINAIERQGEKKPSTKPNTSEKVLAAQKLAQKCGNRLMLKTLSQKYILSGRVECREKLRGY